MPLRDHFRPPVASRHSWDELHGGWPMKIVETLNPQLPPEYTAAPRVHLGGAVEIDAGTFAYHGANAETELPDVDEYEVRVYDVARERRLVAAIELVSPSNKDRPETRRGFVAKCAALLQQQVSVAVVDVVTTRAFNLYADLLAFLGRTDPSLADPPTCIYAVACRGTRPGKHWVLEAWHRSLAVGQPLPPLPIWLADDFAVTLDLETSYEATCRALRIA